MEQDQSATATSVKGIWRAQHSFRITVFVLCIVLAGAILACVINPPVAPPPAQTQIQPTITVPARTTPERYAPPDAALARCHPHLLRAGAAMPPIDVAQMADPSVGHLKVHFWVDGKGLVTRDIVTGANFGSDEERHAAVLYTRDLTFTVPQTPECNSREMEMVADFFVQQSSSGQWATYVRLYPRLSLDGTGAVRTVE